MIVMKFRNIKMKLKKWNKEVFGNVPFSLKRAQEELHEVDLVAEFRDLVEYEVVRKKEVRRQVWSLTKMEEWLWL